MYPDLEYILKKRCVVRIILRSSVFLLFVLGLIQLASGLLQILFGGPFFDGTFVGAKMWTEMMLYSVAEAGKYVLPGLLILISQKGLVQLIVTFPKPECPRCDYGIEKLTKPRCPECGLKLPEEFLQKEDDPDA